MDKLLSAHSRIVLAFSGGKDSLAALWLLRDWWNHISVVWVNTGAGIPETLELIKKVRELVPYFVEVKTDAASYVEAYGWPVDLLPVRYQRFPVGDKIPKLQSSHQCCFINIMQPFWEEVERQKATLVIRGQKACDNRKGPLKSTDVVNGVTFFYPLEGWTDREVLEYLETTPLGVPEEYKTLSSGVDCWFCTAYLEHGRARLNYLRKSDPAMADTVIWRLKLIDQAISEENRTKEVLYG